MTTLLGKQLWTVVKYMIKMECLFISHRLIFLFLLLLGVVPLVYAKNYINPNDSVIANDSAVQYTLLLESVEVSSHKKVLKLKGNALLVDVESDEILSTLDDINDLLGRIPGLTKSGNSVTVLGNRSPVYYIDDKKVTDASEIEMLPVEQIRTIKVVMTANARYDSNGRPVIDIKTKRLGEGLAYNLASDIRQGKNFSQKYRFNLGYNYKKWDIFFTYNYLYGKEWIGGNSQAKIIADTLWNKSDWSNTLDRTGTHLYKSGITYHISPDSHFGILYSGNYSSHKKNDTDSLFLIPNRGVSSFLNTQISGIGHTNVHHVNVYYKMRLGKNWDFNSYGDYVRKNEQLDRYFYERDNTFKKRQVNYDRKSIWNVLAAHLQLSHESEKFGAFAVGYDFSYTYGSDRIIYAENNGNGKTDNKETKNALFVSYTKGYGNLSLDIGLRYEYIHSWQKEVYQDIALKDNIHRLLPSLTFSYSWGSLMQSLSYSIETERPSFTDMNNNKEYTNRYSMGEGNLNLRTQTNHTLSYMLLYKFLYLSLNYEYMRYPLMIRHYCLPGNSAVIACRTENFSDRQALTCIVNLSHTVGRWSPSATISLMKSYADYPGPDGTTLKDGRPIVSVNVRNDFKLFHNWLVSAQFEYNFGGYLQMIKVEPFSSLNFSVRKSFANDRWRLSLNAYDLFNKSAYKGLWKHGNIQIYNYSRNDSRKFGITLTYRFRKSREMDRQTAAETEMSRLKITDDE